MATRYVENYRIDDMNDTQTIQAAINALKDGDTLVFNKTHDRDPITDEDVPSTTYVLDEPVFFTKYFEEVDGEWVFYSRNMNYVTINGNGCTICGSADFINTYGKTGTNNKNALFHTSDDNGCGMEYCTIKNFHFTWKASNVEASADRSIRNMGVGVYTYQGSPYFSNSVIENCTFMNFRIGLYQCGNDSIVRGCKFENCYEGILSDGSVHNMFENNYFYTTFYIGLHLSLSPDSTVRNNKFYKCKNFSIYANGQHEKVYFEKNTDEHLNYVKNYYKSYPLRITIADNKIFGRYEDITTDGTYVKDIGIRLHAVQNAIVTGNHIAGIGCDKRFKEDDPSVRHGYGFGIGINVEGSVDLYQ